MKTLTIVIALIVGLFVLLRIKSAFTKYRAALNALLAKHTYQNLDLPSQQKVRVQTRIILFKGGFRDSSQAIEQLEDRERYGFYALAMAELGILPSLPGESWQYIKNPFVALDNAEIQIGTAKIHLQKAHGVAVDL
jgi:hypothetical protein